MRYLLCIGIYSGQIRKDIDLLLTFSKNQSVDINPLVSFRILIFNGFPMFVE